MADAIQISSKNLNTLLRYAQHTACLNDTIPPPPEGSTNVNWQTDIYGNISAYVSGGEGTVPIDSGGTGATTAQGALDNLYNTTSTQVNPISFIRENSGNAISYISQNGYGINFDPLLLPHWTSAVARVRAGLGNCRIFAIGDSTTFGSYSNGTATGNLVAGSYPRWLAKFLNDSGVSAQWDAFMGDGSTSNTVGANDSRVSIGSWLQHPTFTSTGGRPFYTTTTGAPLTFLPEDQVDTFRVWYIQETTSGSLSYSVNGGAATTVSTTGATTALLSFLVTTTLGSNTLALNFVSGGNVYVLGIEAYNSAQSSVHVINTGWAGSLSGNWDSTATPFSPTSAVLTQAPDLILLDLGINDWLGGTSVSAFMHNMQSIITVWKQASDVIIVTPVPTEATSVPVATQQVYINAMYQLAISNNLPLIDNFSRWGSWERANSAPLSFYANNVHPVAAGYSDFAQAAKTQLLSVC